jgi:hypothetical protein
MKLFQKISIFQIKNNLCTDKGEFIKQGAEKKNFCIKYVWFAKYCRFSSFFIWERLINPY